MWTGAFAHLMPFFVAVAAANIVSLPAGDVVEDNKDVWMVIKNEPVLRGAFETASEIRVASNIEALSANTSLMATVSAIF